ATAPIYAAHRAGIKIHVWVDETRPWLQGAKLTAWELKQEGIPHTLIPDNTGGHLMQNGLVDMVIVGTDRTTRTGNVANKIGTYLKAVAARDNRIPFYVALPSSTFDWNIGDNISDIPIEQRSSDEIKYVSGKTADGEIETVLIAPEETETANYAFDITPSRLITGLITERGVVAAGEDAILELYPEHKGKRSQP
ncbi:MAG: S-methyl-5-thioribose-1-phosphate isomerase, partial [Desulfobulbaceae bacterium]|nr:S-methyl-5-thioribose-1-phosphate isomerase [Desulfobulbaceae bacterium]